MKRTYLLTFATVSFVTVAYLATFRMAGKFFGIEGFGEYALARRTLSLLAPIALLGSDYATARFVAYVAGEGGERSRSYYPAALLVMVTGVITVSVPLLLFKAFFATLLFGSARFATLAAVMPWALIGLGLHSVTYNDLRGELRFRLANLLMAINYGAVPLVALSLAPSASSALTLMGVAWALVAVTFIPILKARFLVSLERVWEVTKYGLPRVPGDLMLLLLYALPSIIVAHLADIKAAGLVALGTSALGLLGSLLSPISFILLPTSARYMASQQMHALRREVSRIVALVAISVVPTVCLVELLLKPLVEVYLGPDFTSNVGAIQILLLAAIPLSLFTVLRSVIDAHHVRAVNTRNIAICTLLFVSGSILSHAFWAAPEPILIMFDASSLVLGILTVVESYRILKANPPPTAVDVLDPDSKGRSPSTAAPAVPLAEQI